MKSKLGLMPGTLIAHKYLILDKLGQGLEGEVFRVKEKSTGIERAAKVFFHGAGDRNRAAKYYAQKLHKLRSCSVLIGYHTTDIHDMDGTPVMVFVSDIVQGTSLTHYLRSLPGRRMCPYQALHLLYELLSGVHEIHELGHYHGDLHEENILLEQVGIQHKIKLIDIFNMGQSTADLQTEDIQDLLKIFKTCIGGDKHYRQLPEPMRYMCCAFRKPLIRKRFRTAAHILSYIEEIDLLTNSS